MNTVIKGSIKLIVLSLGISFAFDVLTSFNFIYVFVYFLSILVVPYWVKYEKLYWPIKLLLVLAICLISSLVMIFSANGIYRNNLNFYLLLYAIVVGISLIYYIKNKNWKA